MKYTTKLPTEKQLVKRGTPRTKECPRLYRFVTQHVKQFLEALSQ